MSVVVRFAAIAALALGPALAAAQSVDPARTLAATCASCHGTFGRALGNIDSLAGMPASKIEKSMADFRTGNKPATVMDQIAKGYSDDQVKLIAAYFAVQKPGP